MTEMMRRLGFRFADGTVKTLAELGISENRGGEDWLLIPCPKDAEPVVWSLGANDWFPSPGSQAKPTEPE